MAVAKQTTDKSKPMPVRFFKRVSRVLRLQSKKDILKEEPEREEEEDVCHDNICKLRENSKTHQNYNYKVSSRQNSSNNIDTAPARNSSSKPNSSNNINVNTSNNHTNNISNTPAARKQSSSSVLNTSDRDSGLGSSTSGTPPLARMSRKSLETFTVRPFTLSEKITKWTRTSKEALFEDHPPLDPIAPPERISSSSSVSTTHKAEELLRKASRDVVNKKTVV